MTIETPNSLSEKFQIACEISCIVGKGTVKFFKNGNTLLKSFSAAAGLVCAYFIAKEFIPFNSIINLAGYVGAGAASAFGLYTAHDRTVPDSEKTERILAEAAKGLALGAAATVVVTYGAAGLIGAGAFYAASYPVRRMISSRFEKSPRL